MNLSDIRKEYQKQSLNKVSVVSNALTQLERWLFEAKEAECPEYSAMTVATANADGQPSIRIVLLKYLNEEGLHFFTNYKSKKGKDLSINHKIAAHFFWQELERQVKIEGIVNKTSTEISDFYFKSRPVDSQISAIVSRQSTEVANRETLEMLWDNESIKWKDKEIERPDYWGGYVIIPTRIEFWQGRPNRLHDRIEYKKSYPGPDWNIKRLAP